MTIFDIFTLYPSLLGDKKFTVKIQRAKANVNNSSDCLITTGIMGNPNSSYTVLSKYKFLMCLTDF